VVAAGSNIEPAAAIDLTVPIEIVGVKIFVVVVAILTVIETVCIVIKLGSTVTVAVHAITQFLCPRVAGGIRIVTVIGGHGPIAVPIVGRSAVWIAIGNSISRVYIR